MTTGEGGLITTDDDRLADWIRLYRNQGMRERYRHEILGYNFRLTDIAAAIGLCQLDKLERNTARRQAIARALRRGLRGPADPDAGHPGRPDARLPPVHDRRRGRSRRHRRRPRRGRASSTGIYYPIPVHRQPYVVERGIQADLPVTDEAAAHTLSLPMFPGLGGRGPGHGHRAPSGPPSSAAPPTALAMTGAWTPDRRARAARRADRARVDGPQPSARPGRPAGRPARGDRRPGPAGARRGGRDVRRPGLRGADGDAGRGRSRRGRHRRPDDQPPAADPGRDRARDRGPRREAAGRDTGRGRPDRGRGIGRRARRPSRSATSSGSTRPSSSSGACSRRAGCRPSSRSRAAAPVRSRPASATSA